MYSARCVAPEGLNTTIVLSSKLCKHVCLNVTRSCPVAAAIANCNDPTLFPEYQTFYDLSPYGGPSLYAVNCTDPDDITTNSNRTSPDYCPHPLVYKDKSDPMNTKSRGQWDQLFTMSSVMSALSLFGTTFMLLTFGLVAQEYNKFTVSLLFFSGTIWLMSIIDVIYTGVGHINVFCPEPGRYASQTDLMCGITGSIFHIGVVGSLLWWTTMAAQLWTSIRRLDPKILQPKFIIPINTSIQLILLIIPLSGHRIMAGTGAVTCWVSGKWYQNGSFWLPLGVCIGLGAIFIGLVIYEIYKIVSSVHHDLRFIKMQIRPFLCVVLIFGSFCYVFGTHFYFEENDQSYYDAAIVYLQCVIDRKDGDAECTVKGPPLLRFAFFHFFIRLFGVTVFILYGLTNKSKQIWRKSWLVNHPSVKSHLLRLKLIQESSTSSPTGSTANQSRPNNNSSTNNYKSQNNSANSLSTSSIAFSKDEGIDSKDCELNEI
eukprot:gene4040-4680_t